MKTLLRSVALPALVLLAAAAPVAPALASPPPAGLPGSDDPEAATRPGQITMAHGTLLRDGRPWQPRGVKLVGRLVPPKAINRPFIADRLRDAQAAFGPQLIDSIQAYGADTVSFSVSQPGLDPQHPLYDPAYRAEVLMAVRKFRRAGFTVMISMQWEPGSGSNHEIGFPTQSTANAWNELLGRLPNTDAGLILDLFNEPKGDPDPQTWDELQAAYQNLVQTVRAAGFNRQIVVVSGLHGAHRLDGMRDVADPANRLVYGVHPYLNAGQLPFTSPAAWDSNFGQFCSQHTCMTTEFGIDRLPNGRGNGCVADAPRLTDELIGYLWRHRMGMMAWAFDYADTIMTGPGLSTPTNWNAWAGDCQTGEGGFGAGQTISDWYHRQR